MKKNLLTVLILSLVLVNLIFTVVLTFTIMPALKNSNKLIADVATAIDLDLNAGKTTGVNYVPVENLATYRISGGETMMIGLKDSGDGKDHICVVSVYFSMDTSHEDYKKYSATISDKESIIKDQIISTISSYTMDEVNDNEVQAEIREELLGSLRSFFDSDFVVDVGFDSILCQ